MNIDKYRILLLLNQNKKLSEIAQILNISQPTVTFHIKSLEDSLNIKLFNSKNKFLSLTNEAKSLLVYANEIVQLEDILLKKAKQFSNFQLGSITIGTTLSPSISYLPDKLKSFTNEHKNLNITLEISSTDNIIKNTISKKYDFGFISSNANLPSYINSKMLCKDYLVLVFPNSLENKLNKFNYINYLNDYQFIHHDLSSSTRQLIEKYFAKHNITVSSFITTNNVDVIKQLIKKEIGISILPISLVKEDVEHKLLSCIYLDTDELTKEMKLIYHKDIYISPVIEKFFKYL